MYTVFTFRLDEETAKDFAFLAQTLERKRGDALRALIRQRARQLRREASSTTSKKLNGKPPALRLGMAKESRYALTG